MVSKRKRKFPNLIGALDIGTSKVSCYIARFKENGELQLLGVGHQLAQGLKAGEIVNMVAAENSITKAVNSAEQMASTTLQEVFVNFSCGRPTSRQITAEVPVRGTVVTQQDLENVLLQARYSLESEGEEILHAIPLDYAVDQNNRGTRGIRDPLGMIGQHLSVRVHVISAAKPPVQNWKACVARAHLNANAFVYSPYAAGLSTLSEEERDLGAILIDLGGGTTTIAIFNTGKLWHTEFLGIGGSHITQDITKGLSVSFPHAERLKTLYGSALPSGDDERELIQAPILKEQNSATGNIDQIKQVPRSTLIQIIQPRAEEILHLAKQRLEAAPVPMTLSHRIILTGEASQLPGMRDLASLIFGKPVRLGQPAPLLTRTDALIDEPLEATCTGLLLFGADYWSSKRAFSQPSAVPTSNNSWWGRTKAWLNHEV